MTLASLSPAFREALAYHWVVGTAFKIQTDDLFVTMNSGLLKVVVRHDGLQFIIDAAVLDMPQADFERDWTAAVLAYNAAPAVEKTAMVEGTRARGQAVELIAAMTFRGFKMAGYSEPPKYRLPGLS